MSKNICQPNAAWDPNKSAKRDLKWERSAARFGIDPNVPDAEEILSSLPEDQQNAARAAVSASMAIILRAFLPALDTARKAIVAPNKKKAKKIRSRIKDIKQKLSTLRDQSGKS